MGFFNKKPKVTAMATLTVNARLQTEERYEFYEKQLSKFFKKGRLGVVDGGETLYAEEGGPINCNININYYIDKKDIIIQLMQKLPAPVGSVLTFADGEEKYELGDFEGMAIYLNGTELDNSVYETCDVNYVVDEISQLIGEELAFFSHWRGDKETALYFYGTSFEQMKSVTEEFIKTYPLCQKCRIEQIA